MTPLPGTTRYLCPLECGWHYDQPPPKFSDLDGIVADPSARGLNEAMSSVTSQARLRQVERTEWALRTHLATHTTEEFVRTIQGLRREIAELRERPVVGVRQTKETP